jgi:hypothetical protein
VNPEGCTEELPSPLIAVSKMMIKSPALILAGKLIEDPDPVVFVPCRLTDEIRAGARRNGGVNNIY